MVGASDQSHYRLSVEQHEKRRALAAADREALQAVRCLFCVRGLLFIPAVCVFACVQVVRFECAYAGLACVGFLVCMRCAVSVCMCLCAGGALCVCCCVCGACFSFQLCVCLPVCRRRAVCLHVCVCLCAGGVLRLSVRGLRFIALQQTAPWAAECDALLLRIGTASMPTRQTTCCIFWSC